MYQNEKENKTNSQNQIDALNEKLNQVLEIVITFFFNYLIKNVIKIVILSKVKLQEAKINKLVSEKQKQESNVISRINEETKVALDDSIIEIDIANDSIQVTAKKIKNETINVLNTKSSIYFKLFS